MEVRQMKYTAIIRGEERDVQIQPLDENRFEIELDGQKRIIDARFCADDAVSLLIDNKSYDLTYSMDGDRVELNFWNQYFDIEMLDERKMRMRKVRSELEMGGPEEIKTSMPGKIVKCLVKPGDVVEPGQGIIIVEAMKMENELKCRNGGVVKVIHVSPGETVESDVVLVEIEPLSASNEG
jgi:acetyl/propionyl-CoA carboxylase alpha subunit